MAYDTNNTTLSVKESEYNEVINELNEANRLISNNVMNTIQNSVNNINGILNSTPEGATVGRVSYETIDESALNCINALNILRSQFEEAHELIENYNNSNVDVQASTRRHIDALRTEGQGRYSELFTDGVYTYDWSSLNTRLNSSVPGFIFLGLLGGGLTSEKVLNFCETLGINVSRIEGFNDMTPEEQLRAIGVNRTREGMEEVDIEDSLLWEYENLAGGVYTSSYSAGLILPVLTVPTFLTSLGLHAEDYSTANPGATLGEARSKIIEEFGDIGEYSMEPRLNQYTTINEVGEDSISNFGMDVNQRTPSATSKIKEPVATPTSESTGNGYRGGTSSTTQETTNQDTTPSQNSTQDTTNQDTTPSQNSTPTPSPTPEPTPTPKPKPKPKPSPTPEPTPTPSPTPEPTPTPQPTPTPSPSPQPSPSPAPSYKPSYNGNGGESVTPTPTEENTLDVLTDDVIKKGTKISIPTATIPTNTTQTSGGNSVIPVLAGISAAAAAGIGAKAYIDRKNNNDNDSETSNIKTEDWSDSDNVNVEYQETPKEEETLDFDDNYTYDVEEPEKYDARSHQELEDLQ